MFNCSRVQRTNVRTFLSIVKQTRWPKAKCSEIRFERLGSSFRQYHVLFYGKTQFNDVSLYHGLQIKGDQLSDELRAYYFLIDEISFAEIVGWI